MQDDQGTVTSESRVETRKLIRDTFKRFDANGDGRISKDELHRIMTKISTGTMGSHEIETLLRAADTNGDGNISYDEFVTWVMGGNDFNPIDRMGSMNVNFRIMLPERFDVNIEERYNMDKLQLGEGGYGKVFIARDRDFENRRVAVKKVTKTGSCDLNAVRTEVNVMKDLDHPNICKLLGTFEEKSTMYFIMELCEGGEVFDRIITNGFINEKLTADIVGQVVAALAYAHQRGIAHRDVKPENVVFCSKSVDDTRVKLIDWGLAMSFVGTPMRSAVGSFTYAAPEVITSSELKEYTAACDAWSTGVLTYVMLSGKPPFWGSQSNHIRKARAQQYPFSGGVWDNMDRNAKDFISNLLKPDPLQRLAISDARAHPWLSSTLPSVPAQDVLNNLTHFSNSSTFTRMCIAAVARQLDHTHLKDIHKVFRSLDKNGDGVLSFEEITSGFVQMGSDNAELSNVQNIFASLDLDGSDSVDYTEFCAAGLGQKTTMQDDVLWSAFKSFDLDNSGFLSKKDLQGVLDRADVKDVFSTDVCAELGQEIVDKFDSDHDGRICFDDWKTIMRRCWEKHAATGADSGTLGKSPYEILTLVSQLDQCCCASETLLR
uniref:non-specific serine/threonine protein kinase n=1 Tax=Noctiluca scintillans TaxID=2966 RepID=A0A7S1F3R7_NOCSC